MGNKTVKSEKTQRALQAAKKLMDQEWIGVGVTAAELEQDERLDQLLKELMGTGHTLEAILADWHNKSADEILLQYASSPVLLRSA